MSSFYEWLTQQPIMKSIIIEMPAKDLLELVRDPVMTKNLRLAKERGELGVLSRQTRDIDIHTASEEALVKALAECWLWHATYPETDDYALVGWLEAIIPTEIMCRALAKISGGEIERLRQLARETIS